ncbi:MAG: ATP-binding protein [Candidatus Kaiserbacteria bacterium]|nr:ATP-binding protein [Candidatus Kaiserbacteria bacterium]
MFNQITCPDAVPGFLGFFDISIAPTLLFYSYFPIVIIALLLSAFILLKDKYSLQSKLLLLISINFSLWVIMAIVEWIAVYASIVHFSWQIIAVFEMLIFIFALYFVAVFLNKKDIDFKYKLLLSAAFLPVIIALPTTLNMSSFDVANCQANNGYIWEYIYIFEVSSIVIMMFMFYRKFRSLMKGDSFRKQVVILALGIFLFLGMFTLTNVVGDSLLVYEFNLIGPVGMALFVALLAFMIVRFKTFNIKLIGAQALIGALTAIVFAALFVRKIENVRWVLIGSLIFVVFVGVLLIRSVKREIEQREKIEKLAEELEQTNGRQETLIHFIGHEVKGFLTKDSAAFASLIDGDFAPLPDALKPFVTQALAQSRDGARSVTDILTASNQKKGTVSYAKESFDLKALAEEVVEKMKPVASGKGLTLSFEAADVGTPYIFTGDKGKIGDNVFHNIIDNSINYTPSGSIAVSLKKENGKFIFAVKDTGIGITEEDKKRLFTEGGHGKDSQKVNTHSTGYGLYIAKNIIDAHKGAIRAESEGEGKGATFVIELPIENPK